MENQTQVNINIDMLVIMIGEQAVEIRALRMENARLRAEIPPGPPLSKGGEGEREKQVGTMTEAKRGA